jgi:hypothetical protein
MYTGVHKRLYFWITFEFVNAQKHETTWQTSALSLFNISFLLVLLFYTEDGVEILFRNFYWL